MGCPNVSVQCGGGGGGRRWARDPSSVGLTRPYTGSLHWDNRCEHGGKGRRQGAAAGSVFAPWRPCSYLFIYFCCVVRRAVVAFFWENHSARGVFSGLCFQPPKSRPKPRSWRHPSPRLPSPQRLRRSLHTPFSMRSLLALGVCVSWLGGGRAFMIAVAMCLCVGSRGLTASSRRPTMSSSGVALRYSWE